MTDAHLYAIPEVFLQAFEQLHIYAIKSVPFYSDATNEALLSVMASPIGEKVRESGVVIQLSEVSDVIEAFQVSYEVIYYTRDIKGFVNSLGEYRIPGDEIDSGTLASFLTHEIGHVIGVGRPTTTQEEEIWTTRHFENIYRQFMNMPLRQSYFEAGDVKK